MEILQDLFEAVSEFIDNASEETIRELEEALKDFE